MGVNRLTEIKNRFQLTRRDREKNLLSVTTSFGYDVLEIYGPWKDLDQGLKNDAVFLYKTQFGVIYISGELLVIFL